MATIFNQTYLKGISDIFVDEGWMPAWVNEKVACEVFNKIASKHQLPQFLESQLPDDVNIKIANDLLAEGRKSPALASTYARQKQASLMDANERAGMVASFYMQKMADEASLNNTGPNTAESAAQTNANAALDNRNRSPRAYIVPRGHTDLPQGGVTGKQMPHPEAPKGPAIDNTLTHLDKQAQLDRAWQFVRGVSQRGYDPRDPKVVLAACGLAEAGNTGLEAMNLVLSNAKTANDIGALIEQVLMQQDQEHHTPDPALIEALEQVLQSQMGGAPEGGMPPAMGEGDTTPSPETNALKEEPAPKMDDGKAPGEKAASDFVEMMKAKKDKPKDEKKTKEAELLATLKAAADGSLNSTGANTPESAAKTNANAKLDMENRKPNEYLPGRGQTDLPDEGQIGATMPAPKAPDAVNPELTKTLTAAEHAYNERVKAAGEKWGKKLPATMPTGEKRATIIALAGMPEHLHGQYVAELSK